MEAPDMIYIRPVLTEDGSYIRRRVRLQKEDNSIEYVRKDAFIEKACEWLKSNLYNYAGEDDKRNIVPFDNAIFHDFKKAMEE